MTKLIRSFVQMSAVNKFTSHTKKNCIVMLLLLWTSYSIFHHFWMGNTLRDYFMKIIMRAQVIIRTVKILLAWMCWLLIVFTEKLINHKKNGNNSLMVLLISFCAAITKSISSQHSTIYSWGWPTYRPICCERAFII